MVYAHWLSLGLGKHWDWGKWVVWFYVEPLLPVAPEQGPGRIGYVPIFRS